MIRTASLTLLLSIWPLALHRSTWFSANQFVVWDVGQGLWTTRVTRNFCYHFDSGGERSPLRQVLEACEFKKNLHFLSHYDWDHMSFLRDLSSRTSLCRVGQPADDGRQSRRKTYGAIPRCDQKNSFEVQTPSGDQNPSPLNKPRNSNSLSQVFLLEGKILIPGDSPSSKEKTWARALQSKPIVLVLGHHGSRTSSSDFLLSKMAPYATAVASARTAKYGHPHWDTRLRLSKRKLILLKTEDWGNIRFELPSRDN